MEYTATAKYLRISTRRVRLVADSVRKLTPSDALVYLGALPHRAAGSLAVALASAVANAKQKNSPLETLRFKTIEVMGGPGMKRFRAVSRGQAHAYKKKMTHIRVILTDEKPLKEET